MHSLSFSDWLDQVENFPVILVPNQRLIRIIQQLLKQNAREQVFISPQILTPWQWLHRCAEESFLNGKINADQWPNRILTKAQASLLWHRVIPTEFPRSVIQQAISARQLCFEWQIEVDYPTAEFEYFSTWDAHFVAHCTENSWCDETRWHSMLFEWLQTGLLNLPRVVVWAEFDSISPIIQSILDTISEQETEQFQLSFEIGSAALEEIVPCPNAEQELLSAAHWCNKLLTKNSTASIAVVIPDLAQRRLHVQTVFDKVIHPERIQSFEFEAPRNFNISAAPKLNEYQMIITALIILQCCAPNELIAFDQISELLRSPYFGYWQNFQDNAKLESALRRKIKSEFTFSELVSTVSLFKSPFSRFLQALQPLIQKQASARALFSDWGTFFLELLNALNWPGSRGLSSHEYQIVQRFQQALNEFAALTAVNEKVNFSEALSWLRRILSDINFQPKTEAEPRIQILGVLEALGQRFDAIWLCGLHDTAWPSAAKPHPLIPVAAQKKVNAPHSSAQRELDYARDILLHLSNHTPHFVASYPQWQEDQALHPSRLLYGKINAALVHQTISNFKLAEFVTLEDNIAPAVTAEELAGIKGGTAIIEAQSRCPLWAFIEFRLHAQALEEPERYMGSRDRGSLLHATLEQVWHELKTHAQLITTEYSERERLIIDSANKAIQRNKLVLDPIQKNIEINRLVKYIQAWLRLESEREAFTIKALEYELNENLAGLPLKVRIDRIDSIEPNISLILDYKSSSKRKLNSWFDDRIKDIQLPLYASFLEADAISFALVTAKPAFSGVSAYKELISGADYFEKYCEGNTAIKRWSDLKQFWKSQLTALAQEFMGGEAANRFSDEDIQYCMVKPLLRQAERVQQWLSSVDNPESQT